VTEPRPRLRTRPRPRRRRRPLRVVLLLAAGSLLFAAGVALGEALNDSPEPSKEPVTHVRTLVPGTLPPERETVTVTVTG
jgi:hypothetical protein